MLRDRAQDLERAITAARALLQLNEHRVMRAHRAMTAEADQLADGFGPMTPGSGNVGAHTVSTTSSTERAASRRVEPSSSAAAADELDEWIVVLTTAARKVHALCDLYLGEKVTTQLVERLRCAGPDGCGNISDPLRDDGLCVECGPAEDSRRREAAEARRRRRHARSDA